MGCDNFKKALYDKISRNKHNIVSLMVWLHSEMTRNPTVESVDWQDMHNMQQLAHRGSRNYLAPSPTINLAAPTSAKRNKNTRETLKTLYQWCSDGGIKKKNLIWEMTLWVMNFLYKMSQVAQKWRGRISNCWLSCFCFDLRPPLNGNTPRDRERCHQSQVSADTANVATPSSLKSILPPPRRTQRTHKNRKGWCVSGWGWEGWVGLGGGLLQPYRGLRPVSTR